jgi:hypothetical protein
MRKAQTPLVRFVVYLLWICCTAFRLVVTSRKPYSIVPICCGFVVEATTNPQHLDMSRCCGFVEKLWSCLDCCGFVVDLL